MSYALRTTVLLGSFWLLVFLAGIYLVHFKMGSEEKDLIVKEHQLQEELSESEELVANLPAFNEDLEESRERWENRSKTIPKQEASHETYAYVDKILSSRKTTLDFDYYSTEEGDSGEVHYSNYRLSGEARFIDLYRFIWYIEHLPRYLRINSLQLAEESVEREGFDASKHWVRFDMSLSALSADRPGFDEVLYAADLKPPSGSHDPFRPPVKVVPKIPPNTKGLPNVFESTLRALTPTQAYLTDQNGELKTLELGDEVYLGKLADILPDENRVVFDLDRLYPSRRVSLSIKAAK